jgi:site-specific recombinase XerD
MTSTEGSGHGLALLAAYLSEASTAGMRTNSIARRRRSLARIAQALAPGGLHEANTEELMAWLGSGEWSLATRSAYRSDMVAFFGWAHRRGHIPSDPTALLPKIKKPRLLPRPISAEEVTRALATADGPIRAMLALAACAGLRCYEISRVRGEHLQYSPDRAEATLLIPEQKGGDEASVPAHPTLLHAAGCMPAAGYWFPGRWDVGHVSRSVISDRGAAFLRSIGINATMHQLRHSFGTQLYEQTHDLRVTQELMRHRSVASTQIYTMVSDTRRKAVLRALSYDG